MAALPGKISSTVAVDGIETANAMPNGPVLAPRGLGRYDRRVPPDGTTLRCRSPAPSQERSFPTNGAMIMGVVHTSRMRVEKHEGPHRTAHLEGFPEPIHFGVHGGIKHFYGQKYGREITGPEYPATLDHIIA